MFSAMRVTAYLAIMAAFALAGCAGTPSAEQRAAAHDDLNPSGRPYVGPPGVLSSTPPADDNLHRLYCHPEGPGTSCARDGSD